MDWLPQVMGCVHSENVSPLHYRRQERGREGGERRRAWGVGTLVLCKGNDPRAVLASQKAHWENVYQNPPHWARVWPPSLSVPAPWLPLDINSLFINPRKLALLSLSLISWDGRAWRAEGAWPRVSRLGGAAARNQMITKEPCQKRPRRTPIRSASTPLQTHSRQHDGLISPQSLWPNDCHFKGIKAWLIIFPNDPHH